MNLWHGSLRPQLLGASIFRIFRLPVVAFGEKDIYRVLLLGQGFQIKHDADKPLIGFYTTRYISAVIFQEAQVKTKNDVLEEWKQKGWAWIASSDPLLSIEEIDILPDRFLWRKASGFGFFPEEEEAK